MQTAGTGPVFVVLGVAAAIVGPLGGCGSPAAGPRDFAVAPGEYERAFQATSEALRDLHFELERVDAASGVITTKPHFSPGLLEPWDPTQSSPGQEWEDTVNLQAREVRVTFSRPAGGPAAEGAEPDAVRPDLREAEGELVGSVWVTLYRQQRAGRRLDSEAVGASTFTLDPAFTARAGSRYLVPLRRDELLEARLAATIREELDPGDADPDHQSE